MKLSLRKASALLCALSSPAVMTVLAAAQDQSGQQKESVAEAARRAKEQKKAASKPAHTYDNDNLPPPRVGEAVNVIGQPAPTSGTKPGQGAAAPAASAEDAKANEEERQKVSEQLKEAKAQLEDAKKDLEIAKRAFDLDRDTYYSNPNFESDKAGKGKLDTRQTDIAAKQRAVEQIQQKVRDLEEKLKALGGTPGQK